MILTHEMLLSLVMVTRWAMKLAEDTEKLLIDTRCETRAERIAGELLDILCEIGGEKLGVNQDFEKDSVVYGLLKSGMPSVDVANRIETLCEGNGPRLISRDDFMKMLNENGGYIYLPEEKRESI